MTDDISKTGDALEVLERAYSGEVVKVRELVELITDAYITIDRLAARVEALEARPGGGMVDTGDSNSPASQGHAGSSPAQGTTCGKADRVSRYLWRMDDYLLAREGSAELSHDECKEALRDIYLVSVGEEPEHHPNRVL